MNALVNAKTVTTKELAEQLGVTPRTIQQTVEKLGLAKLVSQVKIRGKNSYSFTEAQATAIKIELQNHSKIAKNGFDTLTISNDIEMLILQRRLTEYQSKRIDELQKENRFLLEENSNLRIELDESKEWTSLQRYFDENGWNTNRKYLANLSKILGRKGFERRKIKSVEYANGIWSYRIRDLDNYFSQPAF